MVVVGSERKGEMKREKEGMLKMVGSGRKRWGQNAEDVRGGREEISGSENGLAVRWVRGVE